MLKPKIIAMILPAIAFSAFLPAFADTVTSYELRSTIDGARNDLQPGIVQYRRFSTSSAPDFIQTRTYTSDVVAPTTVVIPDTNRFTYSESPVMAPNYERQVFIDRPSTVVLDRNSYETAPVYVERSAPPVVMETYDQPMVVERRYRTHHHHDDRHLVDVGVPLIHVRAF